MYIYIYVFYLFFVSWSTWWGIGLCWTRRKTSKDDWFPFVPESDGITFFLRVLVESRNICLGGVQPQNCFQPFSYHSSIHIKS